MTNIDRLLSRILVFGNGDKFYSFTNSDGKLWIMPSKNMQIAMNLYQPSSVKGKIVKKFFPYLKGYGIVRRILHANEGKFIISPNIFNLISNVFEQSNIEFAVFGGTPGARQKVTLQLSKGTGILGYCKFCENDNVRKLFVQEAGTLERLNNVGMKGVPSSLFCGELENMGIFIQSTFKTNNSEILHCWTKLHKDFLDDLFEKTKLNLQFSDSDYYRYLVYLKENESLFSEKDREVIRKGVNAIEKHYKNEVEFSYFHADFTPWNMFVENGQLCVFDFEYTQRSFPPYMDMIHYILQIAILEKRLEVEQVYSYYEKSKNNCYIKRDDIDWLCLSYLLFIISFYMQLYNGCIDDRDFAYRKWIRLIPKILNNLIVG